MNASSWTFSVAGLSFLDNGPYSFEVSEHEVLGLTGASGVGKTQMLRAMVDVIAHAGELRLGGVSSTGFTAPQWRKKVALIPADSAWWRDTVGEHFGATTNGVNDQNLFHRLGFEAGVLSWRVSRLSTGERQRLALIRALVNQPSVLLLDEPCSALDAVSTEKVEEILAEYATRTKTALIWVSHDLNQLHRVTTRCCRVLTSGLEELLLQNTEQS